MSNELSALTTFTFLEEIPISKDIQDNLISGESAKYAYKTFRDIAIFTDKRIIIRDSQGLTGKKVEVYSIPYSSITMWSTETSGKIFDINTEVELWTKAGHLKLKLDRKIDIKKLDKIIAEAIL